ncbi:Hypothetical predicted protein [Pelobates cultripes]|uniref:Uncharacterized protein n=1 Tax=Pelobates cultripes TaxID=61616 RepID=A0AAD1WXB7_PELCU|nr:Hypothetical predicted protein [Pelobates cultripes]
MEREVIDIKKSKYLRDIRDYKLKQVRTFSKYNHQEKHSEIREGLQEPTIHKKVFDKETPRRNDHWRHGENRPPRENYHWRHGENRIYYHKPRNHYEQRSYSNWQNVKPRTKYSQYKDRYQEEKTYYDKERYERRPRYEKDRPQPDYKNEVKGNIPYYRSTQHRKDEPIATKNRFQVLDEFENQDFWRSRGKDRHKREDLPNTITPYKRRRNSSIEVLEEENMSKKEKLEILQRI